jgi:hypothetical protein
VSSSCLDTAINDLSIESVSNNTNSSRKDFARDDVDEEHMAMHHLGETHSADDAAVSVCTSRVDHPCMRSEYRPRKLCRPMQEYARISMEAGAQGLIS